MADRFVMPLLWIVVGIVLRKLADRFWPTRPTVGYAAGVAVGELRGARRAKSGAS